MTAYCIYEIIGQFYLQSMSGDGQVQPAVQIFICGCDVFLIGFTKSWYSVGLS